ncbi:MAG: hypothetical protein JOS17DRAFT_132555 [Linnemannia elongata]|nr:MAG: hypothetical protein JOS17DRAFT_132555 [Linnemannia elongata]
MLLHLLLCCPLVMACFPDHGTSVLFLALSSSPSHIVVDSINNQTGHAKTSLSHRFVFFLPGHFFLGLLHGGFFFAYLFFFVAVRAMASWKKSSHDGTFFFFFFLLGGKRGRG